MTLRDKAAILRRRSVFLALVLGTIGGLFYLMALLLAGDGLDLIDVGLLGCFLVMLPWNALNFWNAAVGVGLMLRRGRPLDRVVPRLRSRAPLRGRTVVAMPIFEEDPTRVRRHLEAMRASLEALPQAAFFEIHILSDTQDPVLSAQEACSLEAWPPGPVSIHYCRRTTNADAKQGNLWAFLDRLRPGFAYMLVLDADSLMTGAAIHDLVRRMDADQHLGILQTLAVGLPSASGFARLFQYGMRQGMQMFALGAAWWQGATGCYWGHNALIRLAPFKAACRLPTLPGRPPFGGLILSHDQAEAALMRRAGYAVRVLPEEAGSFEENPPTLPEFLKRDLRWCQGNMQYGRLLFWRGLTWMSRLQLLLAMLMYLQAAAWLGFLLLSLLRPLLIKAGLLAAPTVPGKAALGFGLYLVVMFMVLTPKAMGLLMTLLRPGARHAFGGTRTILVSGAAEFLFSLLLMPLLAARQAFFILGLFAGRARIWSSQRRDQHRVPLGEAWRNLGPMAGLGCLLTVSAFWSAPTSLPMLLPVVLPLMLAPFLAWASALPAVGRWLVRLRVGATPEEFDPPDEVRAAGHDLASRSLPAGRAMTGLTDGLA
ncbi:membrane glycosyltransferase [Arboricoccus pini]|uniref:Glucans biosynthesis glucosyltransferase H n=1 Tax=Arboricoccus pini TaxID=1963835 RepID=A0A212RDR7_9PROT|nr:glucans biosynthesis glucosyltransferase MdoH [Arboricoccus pini]SNB70312.1 membrane glycosyltransferase [Arboricoccus pini]